MEERRPYRAPDHPQEVTIRRARLVDVPAVARLLSAPPSDQLRGQAAVSARTITSATRLLLTHVGLEHGEFWVAVGDGRVRAAVVLLPPADGEAQSRLHATLRIELGLPPSSLPGPASLPGRTTSRSGRARSLPGRTTSRSGRATSLPGRTTSMSGRATSLSGRATSLSERTTSPDVPEDCWLLLAAPTPASEAVLHALLCAALARADAEGLPMLTLQPDLPIAVLVGAGFERLPVEPDEQSPSPVTMRPAVRTGVAS
jgi:hypothetical protein